MAVSSCAYGQDNSGLEKVLKEKLPENSNEDGRWVFYPEKASIQKLDKPLVQARIPGFDFYTVNLTNYTGYHVNPAQCLILYDNSRSKVVLVEPLWYRGVSSHLVQLFIGEQFSTKDSLLSFMSELHELIALGSGYRFVQTNDSDTLISYDLGYFKGDTYPTGNWKSRSNAAYTKDGIWRNIMIDVRDLKIRRYTSTDPVTKGEKVIR